MISRLFISFSRYDVYNLTEREQLDVSTLVLDGGMSIMGF